MFTCKLSESQYQADWYTYTSTHSSLFLTITLILGFFTLLSNLQVCTWQESTSSGSRAVFPQVSVSFSASTVIVSDDVSWKQGKTIPLCLAGSYFLGICYLATGQENYCVKQALGGSKSLQLRCVSSTAVLLCVTLANFVLMLTHPFFHLHLQILDITILLLRSAHHLISICGRHFR